jgi:hypothetical protein
MGAIVFTIAGMGQGKGKAARGKPSSVTIKMLVIGRLACVLAFLIPVNSSWFALP